MILGTFWLTPQNLASAMGVKDGNRKPKKGNRVHNEDSAESFTTCLYFSAACDCSLRANGEAGRPANQRQRIAGRQAHRYQTRRIAGTAQKRIRPQSAEGAS